MASSIVENLVPLVKRQYHETESAYVLPNDDIEHDRLNAQAAAITEMIGGTPFKAPISDYLNLQKVVDVGCGTGIATLQLASLLPSAKVYGLDISPVTGISKTHSPQNITWAVGNILDASYTGHKDNVMESELFIAGSLDYVFGRMLFLGINDWSKYFSIISSSLRSGGIVEHQDLDWKFYRTQTDQCLSDGWEWHKRIMYANKRSGLSNYAGSNVEGHLQTSEFEIMSVQKYEFSFVPTALAPNSKHMGRYVQQKLMPQYPELLRKMLEQDGVSEETLERLTQDCVRDLTSEEGIHQKYTVTVARKL